MKKGKDKKHANDGEHREEKIEDSVILKEGRPDAQEKDYDVLWDKFVRLQAEFDNYRKRSFREKAEFVKFANEGLILELIEILDNFERGIKSAEQKKDYELLHQGVNMISKQLHSLLETKGLSRIESVGRKFDPHKHEALEVVESDLESEMIIEELQPGYTLNSRIIRPAKVKVAKKSEDRSQKTDNGEQNVEEQKTDSVEIEEEGFA